MPPLIPIILCGGTGSRLYPLSTPEKPKQFLTLYGEHSLLQNTILRLPLDIQKNAIFVTKAAYLEILEQQLADISIHNACIILEPEARNSAPAISIAIAHLNALHHHPFTALVLPADHYISPISKFHESLQLGIEVANQGQIVTFGIHPTHPSTDYGYIEQSAQLKVKRFIEKPDIETAKQLILHSYIYWNSGIFMFTNINFASEANLYMKSIWDIANTTIDNSTVLNNIVYIDHNHFSKIENISIDYALLEKAKSVSMIPAKYEWSDLGSFEAIEKLGLHPQHHNLN